MKKRVKNRITTRAQGHVEFMISFVLFVSAVVLLFIFLNPLGKTGSTPKIQENAKNLIIENISAVVGKLDIRTQSPHCYNINLDSYGNNFYEKYQDYPNPGPKNRSYELYFSSQLINNHTNYIPTCSLNFYSIGVYSKEVLIIKNKTINLKKNYEENYKELKKSLGISNDFSFSFKYKNGNINQELSVNRNTSRNVEKFASEFPVRVIDDNANIGEMIININLW